MQNDVSDNPAINQAAQLDALTFENRSRRMCHSKLADQFCVDQGGLGKLFFGWKGFEIIGTCMNEWLKSRRNYGMHCQRQKII